MMTGANKLRALWRSIDAKGGAARNDYDIGYNEGITQALCAVENLGFEEGISDAADTIDALVAALEGLLSAVDHEDQAIPVVPDGGCIDCTHGVTPNDMNTGPCAYHRARKALALAKGDT